MIKPSHHGAQGLQQAWIVFGGQADMGWQRLLRPGFRHCFAALRDQAGWLVLDPLSGCLVLARIEVPAGFDLPAFYRRAGLTPLGPFAVGTARTSALPALLPMNCVGLCRAVIGAQAPFALTPHGLHEALSAQLEKRKISLTSTSEGVYTSVINGRTAPAARPAPLSRVPAFFASCWAAPLSRVPAFFASCWPAPLSRVPAFFMSRWPAPFTRALAFFSSPQSRRETPMGSLFKAPKPVRIDPPAPPPQPVLPEPAQVAQDAGAEARRRTQRGIQGTINTSARGVLDPQPIGLTRKSLLGE